MNAQDIIKSLSNLERSLQGVESARQQVEKTVAAYDGTQKQLAFLAQEFANISNNLNSVINVVKNNQEQLAATFSTKVEYLLTEIDSNVAVMGDKALEMNQTFETNCIETTESINRSIDSAIAHFKEKVQERLTEVSSVLAEFNSIVNDIRKDFRTDNSNVISTLQETGKKIVIDFQGKIENHLRSFFLLKGELESLVNQQKQLNAEILTRIETETASIKSAISDLDCQLKGIKDNHDEYHKELIGELSAILQGNNLFVKNLSTCFNVVDGNIIAVKDVISSVSTQLDTITSQIVDNNKQILTAEITIIKAENSSIKKLVFFCLIATTISMILNILMILR